MESQHPTCFFSTRMNAHEHTACMHTLTPYNNRHQYVRELTADKEASVSALLCCSCCHVHCLGSSGPQEIGKMKTECALIHEAVQVTEM